MTTEELLDLVLENRLRTLHTALPCKVQSYDAASQTCDCLPMLKRQIPDGEGGYSEEELPVLANVPVAFPRGGGGFFMSFPLAKDDFVFVVFSERAIGAWRNKGGKPISPGDLRLHPLAGAVAFPALYPTDDALDDAHASNMVIGKDGGAQIHVKTNGQIHLGEENASSFVALADYVNSRIATIQQAFDLHTHTETGVTTKTPTATIGTLASVAASKVKAT